LLLAGKFTVDGDLSDGVLLSEKILVLVDTNAWLKLVDGRGFIDEIEEALDIKPIFYCTESVLRELRDKSGLKGAIGTKARKALELAEKICKSIKVDGGSADKDIINTALEYRSKGYTVIVVTSDRELRRKLRKYHIITMYYREKQDRFELEDNPVL
jgi:rRNA-processing protein FCF1